MSLTSIFQTAKLALEMAEDAEKAAEAVTHAADDEAKGKAARDTLAATKVSTIHAKAVVDSVYVMLELGTDTGTEIQNRLDKNPEQIQKSLDSIPEQNQSILDRNHLGTDDDEKKNCKNCKQSVCQHGKLLVRWKGMGDIKNAGVKDTLTEKFGRVYSTKRNKWNCIKIQWDREELWQNVNLTTRKIVYHCKDDIHEANETEVEEESLSNFLSSAGDSVVNDEKDGNAVSDQLQKDPSDSTSKGIEDSVKTPKMFFENNLEGEVVDEGPMDDELEAENCMAVEPTEETDDSSTAPAIHSASALSTQNQ